MRRPTRYNGPRKSAKKRSVKPTLQKKRAAFAGKFEYGQFEPRILLSANESPINSVPTDQTTYINSPLAFTAYRENLVSTSDADAELNPVRVTLMAEHGHITLINPDPDGALTYNDGDGFEDVTMTFTGRLDTINTALEWVSFQPDADFLGTATVTITTNDQGHSGTGGPQEDTDTINVEVTEVPAFDPPPEWTTFPSQLDTSFDEDGIRILQLSEGKPNDIRHTRLLKDGKILASGSIDGNIGVIRFNSDLTLDQTFGTGGFTETQVSGNQSSRSMELDKDGKILIGGYGYVLRYTPDGILDASFGSNGRADTSHLTNVEGLTVQADGKILAFGSAFGRYGTTRFLPDGAPDPSWSGGEFGNYGDGNVIHTPSQPAHEPSGGILTRDDGDIIMSGHRGPHDDYYTVRWNQQNEFEDGFYVEIGPGEHVESILELPDGKFLTIGRVKDDRNGSTNSSEVAILRYNSDGSLDTTFGINGDGAAIVDVPGHDDEGFSATLQNDGKILVAGTSMSHAYQSTNELHVIRMSYDGVVDTDFHESGILHIPISDEWDSAYSILSLPDGKILVAGTSDESIALVRLLGDSDGRPLLDPIDDVTIPEDSNQQTIDLTGIYAGPGDDSQNLRVKVASKNTSLIPKPSVNYTNGDNTGSLSFTPGADQYGTTTITVTVEDAGANGEFGGGKFEDPVIYQVGEFARGLVVGDVNNDGELDLVTANPESNNVSILLGAGDGSFSDATNFDATKKPRSVAIADFNEDGNPDLAVANSTGRNVSILIGNGDGTFGGRINYNTGDYPKGIKATDLNEDGHTDLVVVGDGNEEGHGNLEVFFGVGDGSFGTPTTYPVGNSPQYVLTADVNQDGHDDVLTANTADSTVSVLLGNGDGTLESATNYPVGTYPYCVATGDFNADGKTDLVTSQYTSSDVSILLGNGDGTFGNATHFPAGVRCLEVAVADLDGDGVEDLVVTNSKADSTPAVHALTTLFGLGDGTFSKPTAIDVSKGPNSVVIADFNGDGLKDIASANNRDHCVNVLLATPDNDNLTFSRTFDVTVNPVNDSPLLDPIDDIEIDEDAAEQTINLNGIDAGGGESQNLRITASSDNPGLIPNPNITYANGDTTGSLSFTPVPDQFGTATITVSLEDGGNDNDFVTVHDWQENGIYPGDNGRAIEVIDLDGDGDLDMVSASYTNARLSVRMNLGDGTFGAVTYFDSLNTVEGGVATADFDGDGFLDLVVTGKGKQGTGKGKISLHISNGDGTFAPSYEYPFTSTEGRPCGIVAGDFTGDDVPDVAVVEQYQSKMEVYEYSRLSGVFRWRHTEFFSEQPSGLAAVDVDGDNDLDLIAGVVNNGITSNIAFRVHLNDGLGGFDLHSTINNLDFPNSFTFGDIDHDGDQDFVTNVIVGDQLTYVYANDGNGNFTVAQTIPLEADTAHNAIELTDINSDGWLDLIVVQGETSQMTIYTNEQGLFESYADLSVGLLPVTLKSADLDGDGDIDHLVGHKASDSNHNGSDNIYVMENLWESANRTTTTEFTITVNPANDAPLIDPISDIRIAQDAVEQVVDLTGIFAGGGENQPLKVTATSNNFLLIPTTQLDYTSPSSTGTLRFTPAPSQFGTAVINVTVEDGGDDNDLDTTDDNLTTSRTFMVTVQEVNELGPVDYFRDEGVTVDGERWYQGSTSQAGLLTVLAQFDADSSNGDLEIELLDAQKQLIASATPVASGLRIDYTADVGETFYLKLIGDQTDIDLRILNLVEADGDTVTVAGTDSADNYSLTAGANHRLVVHGIDYTFSSDDYDAFNIDGAAGADSIWIGGTSDAESVDLRMADTQITGAGYTVQALNISDVVFAGRGGTDTANFYDTNAADTFSSSPNWSKMVGSSYSHIVRGLPTVTAHATIGYDLAYMNDSAGDDTYETFSDRVVMTSDTHVATAIGFKRSSGTSTGGNDTATAHDSAGNDRLLSYDDRIILFDGTHTHTSIDFTINEVFASGQAGDVAYMFDSAGADQMVARPGSTVITQSDRQTTAHGFAQSFGYASTGHDTAEFYDTAGNNDYNGYMDRAVMKGDGIFLWGRGFDQMAGYFSSGSDRALMFDSEADEQYVSGANDTTMSNESATNRVVGYSSIYAYSESGTDTATLHDTAGQETFRAYPDKAVLHGDDMFSWTRGFSQVTAHSSGGTDEAQFFDSAGDDTFRSEGATSQMSGDGYLNLAQGFLKNSGYSSGGTDTALMFDTSGDDQYRAYSNRAVMIGSGITNTAYGFGNTQGFSNTGTDSARLFDSAGDDLLMSYADRATLSGDGWANEVVGFYLNTVYGSSGYDQATMEDSTGDDLVKVRANGPRLTQGDGTVFDVRSFDRILARSVNGGEDIAELLDVDYEFELEGDWNS